MKNERMKEVVRFGIVGVIVTIIHYAVFYVLLPFCDKNVAYTIGYLVSFLCNFLLSARFTFKVAPSWPRFFRFSGSHVVNYFVQMVLFNFFCWIGIGEKWAPLPVYAIAVPLNFLLVRLALKMKNGKTKESS